MNSNYIKRIEAIEQRYKKEPIMCLTIVDGLEKMLPLKEVLSRDLPMCGFVGGSDLNDLDLWLAYLEKIAMSQEE